MRNNILRHLEREIVRERDRDEALHCVSRENLFRKPHYHYILVCHWNI